MDILGFHTYILINSFKVSNITFISLMEMKNLKIVLTFSKINADVG
jgi:hypothetical protein